MNNKIIYRQCDTYTHKHLFINIIKAAQLSIGAFLITFYGCKNEKKYKDNYTLVADKERIDIPIGKYSKNFSICSQHVSINDSNYLAMINQARNSIEIYNLDSRKLIKEIIIKIEGPNSFGRFLGFIVKNSDTIVVINQMPQLIGLVNNKGEVIRKIPYSKDINGHMIQMTFPLAGQRPFFSGNSLFISQLYRADESSGIFTSAIHKHSYLNAKIDLKTEKCQLMPLTYPEELVGQDILGMEISRVLGFNNCFVYHFGIIDGLFISKNKLDFKKKVIETNYRLILPENQSKYNSIPEILRYCIARDEVQNILYDSYRECYYLIVRMREEHLEKNTDMPTKFLYPHCLIIVLDKNLRHMGDVFLSDNMYSVKMMFVTPEGLYISEDNINNPTFSEDYMRFRLFRMKKLRN